MKMYRAWRVTVLALMVLANAAPLAAQEARDPTVAPGETGSAAGAQSPTGVQGTSVVVRDGKPYLVVGTRLYAPGDRFGNMRVERISETEVVLHDGTGLVRMPRFAGIERKTVVDKPFCPVAKPVAITKPARAASAAHPSKPPKRTASQPRAHATKPPAAVAPCEDTPS